jgi:aldehyde:ferredoxin oxidoreductase
MGADHTAGNLVGAYLGGVLNPLEAEGQVKASREAQIAMASLDCTGLCLLAGVALTAPDASAALLKMINAKFGTQLGADDIPALGIRVLKAELEFNRNAGFTNKDDRLAKFFYEEPLPPHNKVFVVTDEDIDSIFDFE